MSSEWMIGILVAISALAIIFYWLFYPMFQEAVNRFWEEIDRIIEKLKE